MEQLRQAPEPPNPSPPNPSPPRTRWTLQLAGRLCPALQGLGSLSGIWRRLKRWRIVYKRGRRRLHSPDPQYQSKLQAIQEAQALAQAIPEQMVLLYADEKTFYRQPLPGQAWGAKGSGGDHQPPADLSHRSNSKSRLVGALDAVSGRLLWRNRSRIGVGELVKFLEQVREAYPDRKRIVMVWDNWPVHAHPLVLAAAKRQGIELLFLPTYAPWTNPIEKLWCWLQQEVLLMHRLSDQWEQLKERVGQFLDRFEQPSLDLLRYVGLLPD